MKNTVTSGGLHFNLCARAVSVKNYQQILWICMISLPIYAILDNWIAMTTELQLCEVKLFENL